MSVRSYEFEVKMHCGGCSGAVGRVLGKLEGAFLAFSPASTAYSYCFSCAPLQLFQREQTPSKDARLTTQGVKSYTTSLETQKVNVIAEPELGLDKVLETIAKTGKQVVSSKELDGSKEAVGSKEL
jgi:copper chaperone CopZ